jgi:hypothetical protein
MATSDNPMADELAELAPYARQDEANTTTPPGVAPDEVDR